MTRVTTPPTSPWTRPDSDHMAFIEAVYESAAVSTRHELGCVSSRLPITDFRVAHTSDLDSPIFVRFFRLAKFDDQPGALSFV